MRSLKVKKMDIKESKSDYIFTQKRPDKVKSASDGRIISV